MRFRADAYHGDSEGLDGVPLTRLLRCPPALPVQQIAIQTLVFTERWRGCWETRAEAHWYRIIASRD